jgi:hypothetical protein
MRMKKNLDAIQLMDVDGGYVVHDPGYGIDMNLEVCELIDAIYRCQMNTIGIDPAITYYNDTDGTLIMNSFPFNKEMLLIAQTPELQDKVCRLLRERFVTIRAGHSRKIQNIIDTAHNDIDYRMGDVYRIAELVACGEYMKAHAVAAHIYCTNITKRPQARILFDETKRMVERHEAEWKKTLIAKKKLGIIFPNAPFLDDLKQLNVFDSAYLYCNLTFENRVCIARTRFNLFIKSLKERLFV